VRVAVETLTPAQAQNLLDHNPLNRNRSVHRVAEMTETFRAGGHRADIAPILISNDNSVIDGQHRLAAQVASETTLAWIVVRDVDASAQLAVDTGKPRSFDDYLTMHGVKDSRALAAATRFLWNYQNSVFTYAGNFMKRPMASVGRLWELYQSREGDLAEGVLRARPVLRSIRMSRATASGLWVVLSDVDFEDAAEFYAHLGRQADGAAIDGVELFRNKMNVRDRAMDIITLRTQAALLIKAWNSWRRGEPVAMLTFRPGGARREGFPAPA